MKKVYVGFIGDNISKISFYSNSQGYVVFYSSVGFTADSGRTFTKKYVTNNNVNFNGYSVNLTFGFKINGVKAFSQDSLIVYGDYGRVPAILYSANGGTSFTLVYHSQLTFVPNSSITDMIFPDNGNIGYAVDADRVLKTTNRGSSWYVVRTEVAKNYNSLDAIDVNTVFAYTNGSSNPSVLRSTDAGNSWIGLPLPSGNTSFLCADFVSLQKGWVNMRTNTEFKLYYTSNGGANWEQISDNETSPFAAKKITFINDTTGYALAEAFKVLKTTSGGRVWEPLPRDNDYSSGNVTHNDLQIRNNSRLWAGGGDALLELNVNPGGAPRTKAYYKIDRSGSDTTGIIKLVNFSNANDQCRWYRNNVLISTSYHSSYMYDPTRLRDTISLVVTDGFWSDSVVKYIDFPPPISLSHFSPASGNRGNTIIIRGNNLLSVTSVYFGGSPATNLSIASDTLIYAAVGEGASGFVTIRNVSKRDSLPGFKFTGPLITSFTPDSAQLGVPVTIRGENLSGITTIDFGYTPVSSFSIIDSTTITAITGAGSSGPVQIYGNNGSTSVPGFVYNGPTIINSFSPSVSGPLTDITINGVNLLGTYSVSFGDSAALSFSRISASKIIATVKQGSSGNVSVSTNANTATLGGYIYISPPVITSFTPLSAQAGATVIITGKNFNKHADSNAVYFGGAKAIITNASDTMLTVIVPSGATASTIALVSNRLATASVLSFVPAFPGASSPVRSTAFKGRIDFNTRAANYSNALFYDFDGDGKKDMVLPDMLSRKFSIYQNTSTNNIVSFGGPREFFSDYGFNEPYIFPQAADMDGDGKPDLVLEIFDRDAMFLNLYIYRNISANGVIAFDTRIKYISYQFNYSHYIWFTLNDLDGDGRTDFVYWYGDGFSPQLHFYKNTSINGIISFADKKIVYQDEGGFNSHSMTLADIDGDGKSDIVLGRWGDVRVALNKTAPGNISFGPNLDFSTFESYLSAPLIVDINEDKKPDLLFYNFDSVKFTILKNKSIPGTVSFAPKISKYTPYRVYNFSVADVDGDTKPDIISTDYAVAGSSKFSIFRNISSAGNISFADSVNFNITGQLISGYGCDFSGDGRPELIFSKTSSSDSPDGFTILTNRTTGSSVQLCANGNSAVTAEVGGTSYQWQQNTGIGFINLSNNANITGSNTTTLQFTNIPQTWDGYQYRCVIDSTPGFFYTLQFANTWKGTISNAWENAANWSCGIVPNSSTNVIINSGTVILNSNTIIKSLRVNPDAILIVNPGFTLTVIN